MSNGGALYDKALSERLLQGHYIILQYLQTVLYQQLTL